MYILQLKWCDPGHEECSPSTYTREFKLVSTNQKEILEEAKKLVLEKSKSHYYRGEPRLFKIFPKYDIILAHV